MDKVAKVDDPHSKKKVKLRHATVIIVGVSEKEKAPDGQTTMFNYKEKILEHRSESKQTGEKKESKKDGSKFTLCPTCNRTVITAQLAHHIDSKCEQYNHNLTVNGNIEITGTKLVTMKINAKKVEVGVL